MAKKLLQFYKYAAIGVIGTAAHYIVLILGVTVFGSILVFTSLGFIFGAIINHHLNRRFTFGSDKTYAKTLLEFFNVAIFMFFINFIFMYFLTKFTKIDYRLSQVFTTAVTFLVGFFLNKYFVFKKERG